MRFYILYCLVLVTGMSTFGQSGKTISGEVITTSESYPLKGATVYFKNGGISEQTNERGHFSLWLNKDSDTLVVTHVGYRQYRLFITGTTILPLKITLEKIDSELSEVVVSTGYQDIPRERATGSFYRLDNSILNQRVSSELLSRLDGITSSLLVDKRNANQGTTQIRGLSTLTYAATNPLVILDNFPYPGKIENINPNDIEAITVLKDAAATSIWGARAGNGVIVITSKKAKAGQPLRISFNSNLTISPKSDLFSADQLSVNSTIQLEEYLFDKGYYDGLVGGISQQPLTPVVEILLKKRSGTLSPQAASEQIDQLKGFDVRNDMERYLYRTSAAQQYSLNLSGAGKATRYLFSVGYDRSLSELVGNSTNRVTLRTDNTIDLHPHWQLQIGSIFTLSQGKINSPGGYGAYSSSAGGISPYARLADDNGQPLPIDIYYRSLFTDTAGRGRLLDWKFRPLQELRNNDNTNKQTDVLLNLGTQYQISSWLKADIKYQLQQSWNHLEQSRNEQAYYVRDLVNLFTQIDASGNATYIVPKGGMLNTVNRWNKSQSFRGQLSVNKRWNDHELNMIAGGEIRELNMTSQSSVIYGYSPKTLTSVSVDYTRAYPTYAGVRSNDYIIDGTNLAKTTNRFTSLYSNAAYTFRNKYTVSASIRKDASNLFGVRSNQKGIPLWSTGFLWKADQEDFYKIQWLPQLSVRASYGFSGNLDPTSSALTKITYYSPSFSPINVAAVGVVSPSNPDLRWERVKMWNVGIDGGAKNGRITGTFEYYQKHSMDLINTTDLDPTSGFLSARRNTAEIKGSGIDVVINSINTTGLIRWKTMALFNYVTYKVTRNQAPPSTEGLTTNGTYIFPVLGYSPYVIISNKWAGLDPETGDPLGYINGQVSKDYTLLSKVPITEQVIHGNGLPRFYGTLRNTVEFKGLTLAVNMTYKLGYYFRRPSLNYSSLFQSLTGYSEFDRRWQNPGDERYTNVPSMKYPANSLRDYFYNQAEINVEKADHVRLNDIYLSYNLPNLVSKSALKGTQLYGYISNLNWVIWKANHAGTDPEIIYGLRPPIAIAAGIKIDF